MRAFIIFWSSLIAMILWVFMLILKGIQAILCGLVAAMEKTMSIAVKFFLGIMGLVFVVGGVQEIQEYGFSERFVSDLLSFLFFGVLFCAIVFGIGKIVVGLPAGILEVCILTVGEVIGKAVNKLGRAYNFLLKKVDNQLKYT